MKIFFVAFQGKVFKERDCIKLQKLTVLERFTNAVLCGGVLIFALVSLHIR